MASGALVENRFVASAAIASDSAAISSDWARCDWLIALERSIPATTATTDAARASATTVQSTPASRARRRRSALREARM